MEVESFMAVYKISKITPASKSCLWHFPVR